MPQKPQSNSGRTRWIAIAFIVIIGAAGAFYAWWIAASGSGEVSQDVAEIVPTVAAGTGSQVYEIQQAGSEARFVIDEVLRGEPYTVVGTTNQIAGQLTLDLANPGNSEVGTILINARSLQTDADQRNRALRTFILRSAEDTFEFIRFEPTQISGLPETAIESGQEISFQITGNLTIVETTLETIFEVTATLGADGIINGTAVATVMYPDFNLSIPRVPFVASVDEDVRLELTFVATPVES